MPSVVAWVRAMSSIVGGEQGGDGGPRLVEALHERPGSRRRRRDPTRSSYSAICVHGRGRLGGEWPAGPGVQVDAGRQRGQRGADRGEACRFGRVGGKHGRMIPAMSGLARPELLATTEWLGEQLGRSGVRIVDARWRPDGSGAEVHRAGHIPGSVHVDWRADLVEPDEAGDALRLASAERIAAVAERAGHR